MALHLKNKYALSWVIILMVFGVVSLANASDVKIKTIIDGLEHPWALAFLPDGRMLVTERPGRLRVVSQAGALSKPIANLPAIHAKGQGGLLDVILDPEFVSNKRIYFSYSAKIGQKSATAVVRATLAGLTLDDVEVIFQQSPALAGSHHYGSRLVIDKEGYLFITLGERGQRKKAQALDNHLGKVVRINRDGSVPQDNPFIGHKNALPEIWSFGHRNPQGAALHPETGQLWIHEHGPRGGDEINIPKAGKNYGWPLVSFGSHYSGIPIPDNANRADIIYPLHYWTPSIAPSGMMFYVGNKFPSWQGSLFVGALAGQHVARLELDGQQVLSEEKIIDDLGVRVRDIAVDSDGYIYLLSDDNNGKILKLMPR